MATQLILPIALACGVLSVALFAVAARLEAGRRRRPLPRTVDQISELSSPPSLTHASMPAMAVSAHTALRDAPGGRFVGEEFPNPR